MVIVYLIEDSGDGRERHGVVFPYSRLFHAACLRSECVWMVPGTWDPDA